MERRRKNSKKKNEIDFHLFYYSVVLLVKFSLKPTLHRMENIPKLTSSTKTVVKPMVEMVVARPPSATIVKPTITTVGGAESVHGTT